MHDRKGHDAMKAGLHYGCLALVVSVWAATATAEEQAPAQPPREMNALSGQEINGHFGRLGRTFVNAAELGKLPASMRVLDRADELGLDAQQRARLEQLMAAHEADARELAAKLIQAEVALAEHFRAPQAEQGALAEAVGRAVQSLAAYVAAHVETDRRMRALLTEEQVARFDALRSHRGPAAQPENQKHSSKDERSIK